MHRRVKRVHFVGIGGIGMSGIAEVLLNLGYQVSGSDAKTSDITDRLKEMGAAIFVGHAADNIQGADVVVTSSAIRPDNPEITEAQRKNVPVIPRAEMLAELMRMKDGIAVGGSHGKTTTTSMIATILAEAGMDPTAVIGGRLDRFGSNAKLGKGDILVAEADESDGSFLLLTPMIAVVTNIDAEHLDHYGTMDDLFRAFRDFANKVPFYGLAVLCHDHPNVQRILPEIRRRYVTYGRSVQAEYRATDVKLGAFGSEFTVWRGGFIRGRAKLKIPGVHNVDNALAAFAVAEELEIPPEVTMHALATFGGVRRRFETKGIVNGVRVVEDYGHHPAEIRATLAAARTLEPRRIVTVFQPHRFTRTRDLFGEFMSSFNESDALVLTDIYAAGEDPITGVTSERLYEGIRDHGHRDVRYIADKNLIPDAIAAELKEGDLVLLLGAGDVNKLAQPLLDRLKSMTTT
ncbi:MAG TPA: UDP-N-acetylmuramate--L-alanine ligase [bacterium]|nr:UDP-N-acetylmuramate--L-alanine ligase [bacterium]